MKTKTLTPIMSAATVASHYKHGCHIMIFNNDHNLWIDMNSIVHDCIKDITIGIMARLVDCHCE